MASSFGWIADPYEQDLSKRLNNPFWHEKKHDETHLLGTDEFGRDIFSRIVWGARTAMLIGFTCAFAASFGGLVVGVASAYFGGKVDIILQRVVDVFIAFPSIGADTQHAAQVVENDGCFWYSLRQGYQLW